MVKRAKTRLPATDFVAGLVHDLKNPLGAAVGNVAYVREQIGTGQQDCTDALEDANDALRRIGALADDLLTVSQHETGTLAIVREPFRIREIFETVARSIAREIALREASISVVAPGELDFTADRALITRALESMIGWAGRQVSRDGAIELRAEHREDCIDLLVVRTPAGLPEEIPKALYAAHCIALAHDGALSTTTDDVKTTLKLSLPKMQVR